MMIRKNFYLTEDQIEGLEKEAKVEECPTSLIVRRAIVMYLRSCEKERQMQDR